MLIKALLLEFAVLFPDVPQKTVIAFHDVDTGNALPIKRHPYKVNPVKLMHMRNEVDHMLQNGVIEPSKSQPREKYLASACTFCALKVHWICPLSCKKLARLR